MGGRGDTEWREKKGGVKGEKRQRSRLQCEKEFFLVWSVSLSMSRQPSPTAAAPCTPAAPHTHAAAPRRRSHREIGRGNRKMYSHEQDIFTIEK